MEYTIQKLSRMAGVSTRTLRYYHEIGLLLPKRMNSSGYRIYGSQEVNTLQQILFYRELGVELSEIQKLLTDPAYSRLGSLKEHAEKLEEKQRQLARLIDNVNKTILAEEGRIKMSDYEKFEGFKKKMIDDNEQKFGAEIREKFGEKAVAKSNAKWMNMSQKDYEQMQELEREMFADLEAAVTNGERPDSNIGREIAKKHKEWLLFSWSQYSAEAHAGVTRMYVEDQRFTAYYDKRVKGCAKFLNYAVQAFVQDLK